MAKSDDWIGRTRDMLKRHHEETRAAFIGLRMQTGNDTTGLRYLNAVGAALVEAMKVLESDLKEGRAPLAPAPRQDDDEGFG